MFTRMLRLCGARAVALCGLLCSSLSIMSPLPALAQSSSGDQPVAFVHGLLSAPNTWDVATQALQSTLRIQPTKPDLPWRELYFTQAASLESQLQQFGSNIILVGHSNGGVVSRVMAGDSAVRGVMTFASPNHGAPLVDHVVSGEVANYIGGAVNALAQMIWAFARWVWGPFDDFWLYQVVDAALTEGMMWVASYLDNLSTQVLPVSDPVLNDMSPSSPFFQTTLPGRQGAEQANAPTRVGIMHTTDNYYFGGPMRAIGLPNGWADAAATGYYTLGYLLLATSEYIMQTGNSYCDLAQNQTWYPTSRHVWSSEYTSSGGYCDPMREMDGWMQSMDEAESMNALAYYLLNFDMYWCYWIGALQYNTCQPSDDVVPLSSQDYPGAAQFFNSGSYAHVYETTEGYDAVGRVLGRFFSVPAR